MAQLSNETIWNSLRDIFPTFASHTAKGTKDLFKSEGFEALKTKSVCLTVRDMYVGSMD